MIEWAVVGRQVVCKDTDWLGISPPSTHYSNIPYLGQILTIRRIGHASKSGRILFLFEEIINPKDKFFNDLDGELGFLYIHFRPVKETSIDCFKSILEKTPNDHLENV